MTDEHFADIAAAFADHMATLPTSYVLTIIGTRHGLRELVLSEYDAENMDTWLQNDVVAEREEALLALAAAEIDRRIPIPGT